MKARKSAPKAGLMINQNDLKMQKDSSLSCVVHQLGIWIMNEFMILFHKDRCAESVITSYYFIQNWMPANFKRGAKNSDARPQTQIINTVEVYMLYMSTCLNETLIRLSWNKDQPQLKKKFIDLLFSIIVAFKSTMKSRNKRSENTIIYCLKYTYSHFKSLLEDIGLVEEFKTQIDYLYNHVVGNST